MREDLQRRRRIKTWTNLLALIALIDVSATVPLDVLVLRAQELTEISTLIGCMQISCHEFLIFISSMILLRCGNDHFDRIDAAGAWILVHFIAMIGNVTLLTFEAWPEYRDIRDASMLVKALVCWKAFFIIVEVIGIIYCYYIVHNPIIYFESSSINHRHANETNSSLREVEASINEIVRGNQDSMPASYENVTSNDGRSYVQVHSIGSSHVTEQSNISEHMALANNTPRFNVTSDQPPPYSANNPAFQIEEQPSHNPHSRHTNGMHSGQYGSMDT